jgi:hypothetical protein
MRQIIVRPLINVGNRLVMVRHINRLVPVIHYLKLVKPRRPMMLPLRQFRRRLPVLQNPNPIG